MKETSTPMKVTINLASMDHIRARYLHGGFSFLCLLVLALLVMDAASRVSSRREARQVSESLQRVMGQNLLLGKDLGWQGGAPAEEGMRAVRSKVVFVNDLLIRRAFSWTGVLSDLETAVPGGISLTRIQPRFPEGTMEIAGKAASLKSLTDFMIRLEASPAFEDALLKDHKTVSLTHPPQADSPAEEEGHVEFSLIVNYLKMGIR